MDVHGLWREAYIVGDLREKVGMLLERKQRLRETHIRCE